MRRLIALLSCAAIISACSGSKSTPTSPTQPTTPTTPTTPTPTNHNPTISLTANPTWAIDSLTTVTVTPTVSDPDGDTVTILWDPGDGSAPKTAPAGASVTLHPTGSGTIHLKATANDGKGGTATATIDIPLGSMTGTWRGSIPGYTNLIFNLTQAQNVVSGTFTEQYFGTGKTDPAAPGHIQADGSVEMRFKLAVFSDFTFRGVMDSSGRRITGGVYGSGFNGEAFVMTKQ
jgi:hypothetical protein